VTLIGTVADRGETGLGEEAVGVGVGAAPVSVVAVLPVMAGHLFVAEVGPKELPAVVHVADFGDLDFKVFKARPSLDRKKVYYLTTLSCLPHLYLLFVWFEFPRTL
jgi:hypothetical protein